MVTQTHQIFQKAWKELQRYVSHSSYLLISYFEQAAKYLDDSSSAKEAMDLAVKKEKTRQLEIEENKVKLEIQKSQIAEEERRKTVQYETEMSKRRAEYQV